MRDTDKLIVTSCFSKKNLHKLYVFHHFLWYRIYIHILYNKVGGTKYCSIHGFYVLFSAESNIAISFTVSRIFRHIFKNENCLKNVKFICLSVCHGILENF